MESSLDKAKSIGGKNIDKSFKNQVHMNEADNDIDKNQKILKKKVFNLSQCENMIHNDDKLFAIYNEMAKDGSEKFGYHYNETILNIIYNEYIQKDNRLLQKYLATPKDEKKTRRDKTGIRQLHKEVTGEEMNESVENINDISEGQTVIFTNENNDEITGVVDEINLADSTLNINVEGEMIYSVPLDRILDVQITETTSAGGSGQYSTAFAWANGSKPAAANKPIWKGGINITEDDNYLTESKFFEDLYNNLMNESLQTKEEKVIFILKNASDKYNNLEQLDGMNDQQIDQIYNEVSSKTGLTESQTEDEDYIQNKSEQYNGNDLKNMSKEDVTLIKKDIENGVVESIVDTVEDSIVNTPEDSMAKKGENKTNSMEMGINEDGRCRRDEFETNNECHKKNKQGKTETNTSTKNPENKSVDKHDPNFYNVQFRKEREKKQEQSKENNKPEEKVNESLDFYLSELQEFDKQINMISEDRRPSSLVDLDRLKKQNAANYKQDISGSFIKDEVEKLEKAIDQQTVVGDDPQKLNADIEKEVLSKTKGEALKNVGDSTNEKGNEIPKRNMTEEEANQLLLDRGLGMQDIKYDNKPSERFEERMKEDMGERLYDDRQKKLEYRLKAPMYNKDTQPTQKGLEKNQYNESYITGKYKDNARNSKFVDFKLSECIISESVTEDMVELNLDGLGNKFDAKISINESVAETIDGNKFYFDGTKVYAVKIANSLNESTKLVEKDNSFDKLKHLLNYKPSNYTNTNNVKKNRGF